MTDNSNTSATSSLFGDFISDTPPNTPVSVPAPAVVPDVSVATEGVSDTTLDSVLSAIREPSVAVPAVPTAPISEPLSPTPVVASVQSIIEPSVIESVSIPVPPVSAPTPEKVLPLVETVAPTATVSGISVANPVAEILTPPKPTQVEILPQVQSEIPPTTPPASPIKNTEDAEKLRRYMEQDVIYNSMLRVVDPEQIRLRLAIRYMIMMFAVFLVAAWVVNNRVIMFGFSEFQVLARIRDALFGMIAGLFSVTLWFGSEAWFRRTFMIFSFRCIAVVFFAAVLSALYFPLW